MTTDSAEKSWRELELDAAEADILRAEFVAVDLEFSGLFMDFQKHKSLEAYYKYCADNVWKFATVQLGFCAAYRDPEASADWILCPYNFYVWPSSRRVFLSDSGSLSYLVQAGFDFQKWVSSGFDCRRLAAISRFEAETKSGASPEKTVPANIRRVGLQRIFELIIEHEKPLVTHNGLLDLMHIYDKFIADVRTIRTVECFQKEVTKLFSGGVFDTKYIANFGRHLKFQFSAHQHTTLELVRSHLLRMHTQQVFKLSDARKSVMKGYSLSPLGPGQREHPKAHEAGFDALATAQTFVLEIEKFTADDLGLLPSSWLEGLPELRDVLDLSVPPGRFSLQAARPLKRRRETDGASSPSKRARDEENAKSRAL